MTTVTTGQTEVVGNGTEAKHVMTMATVVVATGIASMCPSLEGVLLEGCSALAATVSTAGMMSLSGGFVIQGLMWLCVRMLPLLWARMLMGTQSLLMYAVHLQL